MSKYKDTYYFSHDCNARNDEKILMLRAEHGWKGYGLYWLLVEMMFEKKETSLKHEKVKGIAHGYNIDITVLKDVIKTCIDEELFVSDGEKFWSESLKERKSAFHKLREKKSKAGKKGMKSRWGKSSNKSKNDNSVITDDNSVITKYNKVKESKVKESKRKKSKVNKKTHSVRLKEEWNKLAKKKDHMRAKRKLNSKHYRQIKTRFNENKEFLEDFKKAMDKLRKYPELQKEGWLNFEFMIYVKNGQCGVEKILDGKYDWKFKEENKDDKRKEEMKKYDGGTKV